MRIKHTIECCWRGANMNIGPQVPAMNASINNFQVITTQTNERGNTPTNYIVCGM